MHVEAPLCPLEVYKLLLKTTTERVLARANAIRSNKWHVHAPRALTLYGPPPLSSILQL